MKTYLNTLVFLTLLVVGCAGNTDKQPGNGKDSTAIKDNKPIDYAAGGMKDLNNSTDLKEMLCQEWDFKEDAEDAVHADPVSNIEVVYRGCCLFSDGSMVKNPRGNIVNGKWNLDSTVKPAILNFTMNDGRNESFAIVHIDPFEMKLSSPKNTKLSAILRAEGLSYTDLKKDPFYISNNGWRFKPSKPESDAEIKERLRNCIRFFILFYEKNIDAHKENVSFIGLPSCFKWYGGGIYIQKERELNEKWQNSYYNKEQAMKAYKLADKLLSYKYTWPKGERNWLKLNVAVLKQMEKKMDEL